MPPASQPMPTFLPEGRGGEDRPRPAPDSWLDRRRRRRLERGRAALRHRRRCVPAGDGLGAGTCARPAAAFPADCRRSGRHARGRRSRRRRRPSAAREPSPGCFDPGDARASTCAASFRIRPERGRAARVAFAMLAAFGVPATLPVAGLVVVASMSTLVPATGRRRDAAGADRGRTPAGRVCCVRSLVLDRDAGRGHAREHARRCAAITLVFGTMRPAAIRAELRR